MSLKKFFLVFCLLSFHISLAKNNISLDFQNISVRQAIQIIAQFSERNMVVSDGVQGNMSLHLMNIAWEDALGIILESRGLCQRKIGQNILISSLAETTAFDNQKTANLKAAPLPPKILQIHYSKAQDIAAILKNRIEGAELGFDNRTNTIVVQESPEKLLALKQLLQNLDKPIQQILIEARIVSIDKNFEAELGARLGFGNKSLNTLSPPQANTESPHFLNVDLPSHILQAATLGTMGLIHNSLLLDLELSALESTGEAKIIARPHLLTTNQEEAVIDAGEEIPYQQTMASGATSVAFKKAVLSLKVTPQILPQHQVLLHLNVSQDKRGTPEVQGVPPIDTRSLITNVVVKNGETIVLGGIYQKSLREERQKVPLLGSIPGVRALFSHVSKKVQQSELLIFVTPKLIKVS